MDSSLLSYSLELVAGSGSTLSVEQRAALQTSLVLLKKNYKFHRVLFWGKILGIKKDYFIAQGRGEDEMQDKKNLYSFNCMDWFLLPSATDSMIEEVTKAAKGRLIGDPSSLENETTVNEESRLAVTVHQIDEEVSVVPCGAFVKNPHGLIQINRSFGGLSHSEARRLDNFLHFRKAKNSKKSILEMCVVNQRMDFLDGLSDDIPKGSWSLQFECASNVCVLRSQLWLGLTFFHVPMTPQHGYIYIGDGKKNVDLPFML
ncbi:radial spoke head protein 9 homolog [Cebidichthys violaceus]|uniref:radial spoke head protein 9 homolog n=1 Tax=Cebidichthys violaceus TaxID=271503 RepID=UPI0035CB7FFA